MGHKRGLYQLYDLTAQSVAGPLMLEERPGPAIRAFNAVLADRNTTPGQYPEQFNLIFLGSQDSETAHIEARPPEIVATGAGWAEARRTAEAQPSATRP